MTILGVVAATETRYHTREAERCATLAQLESGDVLHIAANTPDRVAQRLGRLGAATAAAVLDASALRSPLFFAQGLRASRAVGRLRTRGERGEDLGGGTACRVSPRLLLTTRQLLPSPAAALHSRVAFDIEESSSGGNPSITEVSLLPEELFLSDADLDYTLVALAPEPALASCGWLPLIADPATVLVGERLSLIQHANGEGKRLAMRQTLVVDAVESFLFYQGDSAPATAGAPLFNDQWEVVALHHAGVAKRDSQGELLCRDGIPWREGMGEERMDWLAQEGVRISALVAHIRDQVLAPEAEALRQELLDANPPPLESPEAAQPQQGDGSLPGEVWLPEDEPASQPSPATAPQTEIHQAVAVPAGPSGTAPTSISASSSSMATSGSSSMSRIRRPRKPPVPPPGMVISQSRPVIAKAGCSPGSVPPGNRARSPG